MPCIVRQVGGWALAIFDLFSKRRKRELGRTPDILTYDKIPTPLKVQIVHLWDDTIGIPDNASYGESTPAKTYQSIVQILRKEAGVFTLSAKTTDRLNSYYARPELVEHFLTDKKDVESDIDIIELTFRVIDTWVRRFDYANKFDSDRVADNAIGELNVRFEEHGVGYRFADGKIIRSDSEFLHVEAVKPALVALRRSEFKTPQAEFLSAHEHYRLNKMSESLVDACKAFESTMKVICAKRKWPFDPSKPASHLIQVCLDNGLIPSFWQSQFTHLRGLLEASIPTARNKRGGHGAGTDPTHNPPRELVAYVLHMTAATILFLTEADASLP